VTPAAPPTTAGRPARGPRFDQRLYLEERYRERGTRRSRALSAYYAVKPLLPRRTQIRMRRIYARRQAKREFPRWPIEPVLVEQRREALRAAVDERGGKPIPLVADWPDGASFAAILTHDVEGPAGIRNIPTVLEIERRHGFVSSWNLVAEDYPVDPGLRAEIEAAGCEVGLHGIRHDCRLFESRASFEAELPAIHRYLAEWGADGFRSPATHRNARWMPELGAAYDTSFPDTDPFEPQSGGCCSILPFFLGAMVELPITLVQDHTLWEILRRRSIELWTGKSDWIAANGGLINLITHPDYLDTPQRLRMYEEFLEYLAARRGGWYALPREVAAWWRRRTSLRCVESEGRVRVAGDGAERARVLWTHRDGSGVLLEPDLVGA
jgi:peptidoglycan/xylan/chitin deacetylase (PgdA/CDA1 family)